jgi:adenylyltransferase/sulfurtransferase
MVICKIVNLSSLGARLIPLGELGDRIGELDPSANIVVHCRSGGRSARAAESLARAGFHSVRNLEGGILAWINRIEPDWPRY